MLYENIMTVNESGNIGIDNQTYANITRLDDSEELGASQGLRPEHNLRHVIRNTRSKREEANFTVLLTPHIEKSDSISAAIELENLDTEKQIIKQLRKRKKKTYIEDKPIFNDEVQINSNSLLATTSDEDYLEEAKSIVNKLRKRKRQTTLPKIYPIISSDKRHSSGKINFLNTSFSDSSDEGDLEPNKKRYNTFVARDVSSFRKKQSATVSSPNLSPTTEPLEQSEDQLVNLQQKRKNLKIKRPKILLINNDDILLNVTTAPLNETYANSSDDSHNMTNYAAKKIVLKRNAVELSFDSIIHQVNEAEKQDVTQVNNIGASKNRSPTTTLRNSNDSFNNVIEYSPANNLATISKHLNKEEGADNRSPQQIEILNISDKKGSPYIQDSPSKSLRSKSKALNISHSVNVPNTSSMSENKRDSYLSSSVQAEYSSESQKSTSKGLLDSSSKSLRSMSKSSNISHSINIDETLNVLENKVGSHLSSSLLAEKLKESQKSTNKSMLDSKILQSMNKPSNISHSNNVDQTFNVLEDEVGSHSSLSLQVEKLNDPQKSARKNLLDSPSKNLRSLNKASNISHSNNVDKTFNDLEDEVGSHSSLSLQVEKLNDPQKSARKNLLDSPSKNLKSLNKASNISHSNNVDKTFNDLEDEVGSRSSLSLQVEKLNDPQKSASKNVLDSPSKNLRRLNKASIISHSNNVDKTFNVLEDEVGSHLSSLLQVEKLNNPKTIASKNVLDFPTKSLRSVSKVLNISHSINVDETFNVLENEGGSHSSSSFQDKKLNDPQILASKIVLDSTDNKSLRNMSMASYRNSSHSVNVDMTSSILENELDSYRSSFVQGEKINEPPKPPSKSLRSMSKSSNISYSVNVHKTSSMLDEERDGYTTGIFLQAEKSNEPLKSVQDLITGNQPQTNVIANEDSLPENRNISKSYIGKSNLNLDVRSDNLQEKYLNNQANLRQPTLKEFLAKLAEGKLPSTSGKEKPLTNFINSYVSKEYEKPPKKVYKRKLSNKTIEREYKSLPVNYNKKVFEHFCHHKVTKEAMTTVQQATENFFSQFYDDVSIMINLDNINKKKVGSGHTVHKEHIYTMMKQLELVSSLPQLHAMMQEMLPASEWQKAIPIMHPFDNVYPTTDCAGPVI